MLDARMTHARGEYESVYGRIVSDWESKPGASFSLKLTIPANTRATVYLPPIPNAKVMQDDQRVQPRQEAGSYLVEVGSGSYRLQVK
jgi:alpha-L-rhamnosidase